MDAPISSDHGVQCPRVGCGAQLANVESLNNHLRNLHASRSVQTTRSQTRTTAGDLDRSFKKQRLNNGSDEDDDEFDPWEDDRLPEEDLYWVPEGDAPTEDVETEPEPEDEVEAEDTGFDPSKAMKASAQLVESDLARSYGLSLNAHHRLVVCLQDQCLYALVPRDIESHLRTSHNIHTRRGDGAILSTLCRAYKVPRLPRPNSAAVAGLPVLSGFACTACDFACTNEQWASRHECSQSGHVERTEVQSPLRDDRRFFACRSLLPEEADVHLAALLETDIDQYKQLMRSAVIYGVEDNTFESAEGWVKKSGLAQFAAVRTEKELAEISSWTRLPPTDDDELGLLRQAVSQYGLDRLPALQDISTRTIRKALRSDEPEKLSTYELDYIKSHENYFNVLTRLAAFTTRAIAGGLFDRLEVRPELICAINELVNSLNDHEPTSETVQTALQAFFRTLFHWPCPNPADAAQSPLIIASYAFCIRPGTSKFLRAASTTFYTAAMSWLGRVVALCEIMRLHREAENGTPIWTIAMGVFPSIKNNIPSAWSHLRENHKLAMGYARTEQGSVRIAWELGSSEVFWFDGSKFEMEMVRNMIRAMVSDCFKLVDKLFMGIDWRRPPYSFPPQLHDRWTCPDVGYSFAAEARNRIDRQHLWSKLYPRLGRVPPGHTQFVMDSDVCATWRDDYIELCQLVLTIGHLTGGPPVRGTETVQATMMGGGGRERTMKVGVGNQVFNFFTYHKAMQVTGGRDGAVVHAYDPEVSLIKLIIVAHLREVAAHLANSFSRLAAEDIHSMRRYEARPFGKKIVSADLSKTMIEYGLVHLKYPLTVSCWRQMSDSFLSRFIIGKYLHLGSVLNNLALHGGHTLRTRNMNYGIEDLGVGQLRESDLEIMRAQIAEFHKILGRPDISTATREIENLGDPLSLEAVTDETAGRAALASCMLKIDTLMRQVEELPNKLRPIVRETVHASMGALRFELERSYSRHPLSALPAITSSGVEEVKTLLPSEPRGHNGITLIHGLRLFFNNTKAEFRSREQLHATYLVAQGDVSVAFIGPCDAGKSLAYQLPIWCLDGLAAGVSHGYSSIVIVPYIALADNILAICKEKQIPATIWAPDRQEVKTVVIVLSDTSVMAQFRRTAQNLAQKGHLKRVVIDEGHVYFTDGGFRPRLQAISWVQQLAVPIHVLSATIPPTVASEMFSALGFHDGNLPFVVRLTTARLRADLRAVPCAHKDWARVAEETIKATCSATDRAIIFTFSAAFARSVGSQLDYETYHGKLQPGERREMLQRFADGECRVLVATTALAAGVNLPDVRCIVLLGAPPDAISYEQEIGRGGRNDSDYTVVVLYDPSLPFGKDDALGMDALRAAVTGGRCLRSISAWMHGVETSCETLSILHGTDRVRSCNHCVPDPATTTVPIAVPVQDTSIRAQSATHARQDVAAMISEQATYVRKIKHGATTACCMNCFVAEPSSNAYKHHTLKDCTRKPTLCSVELSGWTLESLRKVPQWHDTDGPCPECWVTYTAHAPGRACTDPEIVDAVCFAAWLHRYDDCMAEFGWAKRMNVIQYVSWLATPVPGLPQSSKLKWEVFNKDLVFLYIARSCVSS